MCVSIDNLRGNNAHVEMQHLTEVLVSLLSFPPHCQAIQVEQGLSNFLHGPQIEA